MADILKLVELFDPLVVPFLAVVGIIAMALKWNQVKTFFSNSKSNGGGNGAGRRDDLLVQQLITQNADMLAAMMKVVTDNTSALRGVTDALADNGKKLDRHHEDLERGFEVIHRRLDNALERRAG